MSSELTAAPVTVGKPKQRRGKKRRALAPCRRHADVPEQRARELRRVMGLSDQR